MTFVDVFAVLIGVVTLITMSGLFTEISQFFHVPDQCNFFVFGELFLVCVHSTHDSVMPRCP